MASFQARRELLNPQFEGYKLAILPQEDNVRCQNIAEHPASQISSTGDTLLFFKEVQSRIMHNHLASDGKKAVYIDKSFNLVEINADSVSPIILQLMFSHCLSSFPCESFTNFPNPYKRPLPAQNIANILLLSLWTLCSLFPMELGRYMCFRRLKMHSVLYYLRMILL